MFAKDFSKNGTQMAQGRRNDGIFIEENSQTPPCL